MIKRLFLNDKLILELIFLTVLILFIGAYLPLENERCFFAVIDNMITTAFKLFTVEGWFEIPEQIIITYSEIGTFFTDLYFIFVVLTGAVFGFSIVNSSFVDAMISDNNDEIEKKIDNFDSKITQLLTKINHNET